MIKHNETFCGENSLGSTRRRHQIRIRISCLFSRLVSDIFQSLNIGNTLQCPVYSENFSPRRISLLYFSIQIGLVCFHLIHLGPLTFGMNSTFRVQMLRRDVTLQKLCVRRCHRLQQVNSVHPRSAPCCRRSAPHCCWWSICSDSGSDSDAQLSAGAKPIHLTSSLWAEIMTTNSWHNCNLLPSHTSYFWMSFTLFLIFFFLLRGYQFFFKGILEGWQQRICEAAWLHTEWGERGSRILQCCSGPWLALLVWLGFSPGAFICPPEIRDYFKLTQMDRINHTWFYFSLLQHNYLLSPPPSRPSPLFLSPVFPLSVSPNPPLRAADWGDA